MPNRRNNGTVSLPGLDARQQCRARPTGEPGMNVGSIMAHQDDEMRCLGTMLKCRARGDRLCFVTLTDGSKGFVQNPSISRAEAAAIRDVEMRAVANAVDAEYVNLGEQDEFLYD